MARPDGTWDPNKTFDLNENEKRAVQERAKMRQILKAEWIKKSTDPHKGVRGVLFDPAIQRYNSMRSNHWENFKATPRTSLYGAMAFLVPFGLLTYLVHRDRSSREKKYRRGEVSYKDRTWKFI